jgi:hypothetical protein
MTFDSLFDSLKKAVFQDTSSKKTILIFLSVLMIHLSLSNVRLLGPSSDTHFTYLAQSFLSGRLDMLDKPPHQNDWASYEILTLKNGETIKGFWMIGKYQLFRTLSGEEKKIQPHQIKSTQTKYFVSFPPFPAILMIPLYLLFGLQASDTLFTVLMAVLNAFLFWEFLQYLRQKGFYQRDPKEDLWLLAMFSLSTAHLWCSVMGKVWFTALIVGVTCHFLFLRFAFGMHHPLLAGIALGCAFSTRTTLVIGAVFFYAQIIWPLHDSFDQKERIKRALIFSIPPFLIGLLLLAFNYARFENPFEFGHTYLFGGNLQRIRDYGLFHPVFFQKNIIAAFLLLPKIVFYAPFILISYHGMAIQFSSPALCWVLYQKVQNQWINRFQVILLVNTLLAFILILLYQNTGWIQYSFRFILDLLPLLVLSIACTNRPMNIWFKTAVIWGIIINLFGALSFQKSFFQSIFVDLPLLLPH